MSFNLLIIDSWGKMERAYSQILKDHKKSMGFNDLWTMTAATKAAA